LTFCQPHKSSPSHRQGLGRKLNNIYINNGDILKVFF
jgi:hypothetical protein